MASGNLSFRAHWAIAAAPLFLLAALPPVYGAANRSKPPSSTAGSASAAGQVLFSTNWTAPAKGQLPQGVTLVEGNAHVALVQGKRFLQVTDSASLDLQLAGELPEAYTVELEMQVPASTGYAVEIRPESASSPAGYATVSRRIKNPVALCGVIGSGLYAASDAQSQLKRYPDAEAKQLRACKIEVDGSGVRVFFAGAQAANAAGGDLGTGTLLRLHIPANPQAPALIGPIKVAAAPGSTVNAAQQARPIPAAMRTYLELNAGGTPASGMVMSVEGGEPAADMVEQPGPNGIDVHPGPVHYTDIVAKVSLFDFGKFVSQWATGQQGPLDGRLIGADFDYKAKYYRTFTKARLAEVAFPAFDGASKDHGYLQLRITPSTTQLQAPAHGIDVRNEIGPKGKVWIASAFKLDIPGLATKRVSRIEPFKLALKSTPAGVTYFGGTRLTVTFAALDAAPWLDWQDEFLLKGSGSERTLALTVLSVNLKDALMALKGSGVGLLSLAAIAQDGSSEKAPRLRAELYVEKWQIVPGNLSQ